MNRDGDGLRADCLLPSIPACWPSLWMCISVHNQDAPDCSRLLEPAKLSGHHQSSTLRSLIEASTSHSLLPSLPRAVTYYSLWRSTVKHDSLVRPLLILSFSPT